MRRKKYIGTVGVLLSLAIVLGSVFFVRGTRRQIPTDPIVSEDTVTVPELHNVTEPETEPYVEPTEVEDESQTVTKPVHRPVAAPDAEVVPGAEAVIPRTEIGTGTGVTAFAESGGVLSGLGFGMNMRLPDATTTTSVTTTTKPVTTTTTTTTTTTEPVTNSYRAPEEHTTTTTTAPTTTTTTTTTKPEETTTKEEWGEPTLSVRYLEEGENFDLHASDFDLYVTATGGNGKPIYYENIRVTLDGKEMHKTTGDRTPVYPLYFQAPNHGEKENHTVTVQATDARGKTVSKTYTIVYHYASEGETIGAVTVILDASTVGLGVLDETTVILRQGDNAAVALLQALEQLGYDSIHDGNEKNGFYLRRISRGDLCYGAKVPEDLWQMILRDTIPVNPNRHDRDSLGEYDYTMGSGWMYSVNNNLYPGQGMEKTPLSPGDTLRISFTLAFGKDVGGYDSSAIGTGGLAGYCAIWRDGKRIPTAHHWQPVAGSTEQECVLCHERKKVEAE